MCVEVCSKYCEINFLLRQSVVIQPVHAAIMVCMMDIELAGNKRELRMYRSPVDCYALPLLLVFEVEHYYFRGNLHKRYII